MPFVITFLWLLLQVLWLAILVGLTLSDYFSRIWLPDASPPLG